METSFHGLAFTIAPGRVFTPRPATEALVDAALAHIDSRPARVADVGTSSTCALPASSRSRAWCSCSSTARCWKRTASICRSSATASWQSPSPPRKSYALYVDREVVFVDGVRTAFGRAGEKGIFWRTRADDMGVKVVRELLRRNSQLDPERIGDVIFAATAQVGDQGLTLGRDVALLAGIPQSVPGFAVDRMCAGALTALTAGAGEIAMSACDVVLAGGIEHMGHHPMGADVDFNPRFVAERLVDPSAVTMGATAENLHDKFPHIDKEAADRFAVASQQKATAAWQNGVMRETVVPMAVFTDDGWKVAD